MADYNDRPWGERRADMRSAKVAFDIVTKQHAKSVNIKDFILDIDGEEPPSAEEQEAKAMAWARARQQCRDASKARRAKRPSKPQKAGK